MNICLCGSEAGFPHDTCCPYPLYRGSSNQVIAWEMAWAKNKQAAQHRVQADALESCDNNYHYIKGDDPAICSCGKPVRR